MIDGDITVNWYAHTNGTFNLNGNNPYISFTVDENATLQKDLLVATASGTWAGTNGNLSFTFDHACAALRFYVKKANALTSTLDISTVKLCNVYKSGNYYYDGTWTVNTSIDNALSDYTLNTATISNLGSETYTLLNGTETDSYLFLVPQTLTEWDGATGTYVEIDWNYNSGASGTAKVPLPKTLVKGKKYDIKINMGNTVMTTYSNN